MNMKKALYMFIFMLCGVSFGQDRPKVHFDSDEELVKSLLARIEDSMDKNNLRDYMACFTKEYASKNKKSSAMMFVEHNLSLDVDNFHIIESNEKEIEFVVKYTTCYSGNDITTIANVLAEKCENGLLVANQQVVSKKNKNENLETNNSNFLVDNRPMDNCPDGKCRKPAANAEAGVPEKRKTFSLFNDANGKPDPNGIMWLDPNTLIEVYPEQYECIGCR